MMVGIWVKRSLRYYGARHLTFAGTVALAAAILAAALLAGESLQEGLRRGLRERLGATRSAVYLSEGVFPAALAERIPGAQAALVLRGELLTAAGAVCADKAQIIGVGRAKVDGTVLLQAMPNGRGRELLPGEEGAVRFEKLSLYSVELPLGATKDARLVRRAVRLAGTLALQGESVIPPDFALRPGSVPPVNVFLPLDALSEAAGVPGMANVLVASRPPEEVERALAAALALEDYGLEVKAENGATRVKSQRVFLPSAVPEALTAAGLKVDWATFHLADSFEMAARELPDGVATNGAASRATPYGFVAALTPDGVLVPRDLKDGEIVINAWLAEAVGARTNDLLTLRWRRFEAGGRLVADSRAFRVRDVLATEAAAAAKGLMPTFPGLAGVDSCAAWDVGMPLEEEKLKDPSNEAYWKQWRETPKAFITFAAGKACFGTYFGEAMSLCVATDEATARRALKAVTPSQAGFATRPVWEEGLAASQGSTDFKGLFAGMAFVLMAAALLLAALSLSLALESRKSEVALFSALGWSRGKTVWTLALEWSVPLALGAVAGGGLGALLARALVWSLGRFWSDAFAGASLEFHFSWPVAGLAAGVSAALTLGVLLWTVWRFARCRPVELWLGEGRERTEVLKFGSSKVGELWESGVGGVLAAGATAVMVLSPAGAAANGAFFGAGFLLMLSMLVFVKTAGTAWRTHGHRPAEAGTAQGRGPVHSAVSAGVCRALQAPRRSAPVVILLAVGAFLTIGILSMKHDPAAGCDRPSSGSGGFASIVTSIAPADRERGLALARRVSGSKGEERGRVAPATVGVVPVRVHEGDEAGCLNMSQPVNPQVVGLDARVMARARAFEPEDSGGVWTLLEQVGQDGAIPALAADQTMLQYSLKAKAGPLDGTVYEYQAAGPSKLRVRIAGVLPVRSGILQGALIVDERQFVRLFPNETGYRLWLCDYAPYLLREAAEARGGSTSMSRDSVAKLRHPEPGVTVETVETRLRLLGSVESAYLDIFLVLGGLGVVLGVAGISLVILRGVQERRGELALLSAVGLSRGTVMRLLMAEYGVLVLAGLTIGVVPALVAIQPAARSLQGALPWQAMAGILAAMFASASVCVVLAGWAASRRFGPEVLKEEV